MSISLRQINNSLRTASPNKNKHKDLSAEGKKDTTLPSSDAMLQVKQSKSKICAVTLVSRVQLDVNQTTWMQ